MSKLNDTELKAFMRLKPTAEDTAAFFDCSVDTVERYIRKHFDCTFADFREQNMVHTRMMLVRTAIQKAQKGDNVMLIFCLKNLCGWRDKPADDDDAFKKLPTEQLIAMVTKALEGLKAK